MNIHEYQAKDILDSFGVPVPQGGVAKTPEEAETIAKELNAGLYVVKAQIHAGGRGKGGGVKLAKNPAEVRERADEILGMQLITHQTGPEGKLVRQVLVAEASDIKNELYLGLVIDRETSRITLMASEEGGVDIEKVAEETPEKIVKQSVDPAVGLQAFQARQLAFGLNLPNEVIRPATNLIIDVYRAFVECDCSLMEINPLAIVSGERGVEVLALDAKINFDDNALYRHEKIGTLRDKNEEDARELEAKESGLSYISLDGNIGCMVNGAGLAMATMDVIKLYGAEPANFLDVGGSATTEAVAHAFRLILSDPKVEAVMVNIFGGIMKCDTIANGIVEAIKQVNLTVPLVVRLEGTNVEMGRKILSESGLELMTADSLSDAAEKAVCAIGS
ncbi:ADP-forming succinate--CoA ligase subunit beta [Candidatus Poribacteria bacterium]|nr:ADP-forming succinate--CoA ligase subunit beta [Candidatus Poribacteria bacterium]